MTPAHARRAWRAAALGALLCAVSGCGQRGALMLPGAQPVEQRESPPPNEPESQDERENER